MTLIDKLSIALEEFADLWRQVDAKKFKFDFEPILLLMAGKLLHVACAKKIQDDAEKFGVAIEEDATFLVQGQRMSSTEQRT
jgi:hypothetical protein